MKILNDTSGLLRRRARHGLVVFALLSSTIARTQAGIIVDTGPGIYSTNSGEALYNYNDNQFLAGAFTVTEDTVITGINGWIGTFEGGKINIGIAQDSSGLPGGGLFSRSVRLAAPSPTAWEGIGGLQWGIAPGTYWVTFTPVRYSFVGFMMGGAPDPMFNYAFSSSGNHNVWIAQPSDRLGVQVFGDPGTVPPPPLQPVPEPATYGLVGGLGLCALIIRKIRKRAVLAQG